MIAALYARKSIDQNVAIPTDSMPAGSVADAVGRAGGRARRAGAGGPVPGGLRGWVSRSVDHDRHADEGK
jgi:hypothetical protein